MLISKTNELLRIVRVLSRIDTYRAIKYMYRRGTDPIVTPRQTLKELNDVLYSIVYAIKMGHNYLPQQLGEYLYMKEIVQFTDPPDTIPEIDRFLDISAELLELYATQTLHHTTSQTIDTITPSIYSMVEFLTPT